MLERISRSVFSCFHRFEHFFDTLTGRAGPLFVTLCTILLSTCVFTFYDVYYPRIFWAPGVSWFTTFLGTLWSFYVVISFSLYYYWAVTILPGSPHDPPGVVRIRPFFSWSSKRRTPVRDGDVTRRSDRVASTISRSCKKCPPVRRGEDWVQAPKPERTHHCSVCKTCWLKFDHHCPWINGCVGLHNERYFLLFMVYLSLGCTSVTVLGFSTMLESLNFRSNWPHWCPRAMSMLLWILSVAMAFALGVMSIWQLWLVSKGESTVEANDNAYYRKLAKHKKRTFINPYDQGTRKNLSSFFNCPWWRVLLPVRNPPYSDGWTWERQPNSGVEEWEELTDDEDGEDD